MITRLDLRHFKCFREIDLPLGALTLLSGANASGKSAVMHALALLHQTTGESPWQPLLILNGPAVRLGAVSDVVDRVHGRRSCDIGLQFGGEGCQWRFRGEPSDDRMELRAARVNGQSFENPTSLEHLPPPGERRDLPDWYKRLVKLLSRMTYITAWRFGPTTLHGLGNPYIMPAVGPRGHDMATALHYGRDEDVLAGLRLPDRPPTRWSQVVAWMDRFFPGFGLELEPLPDEKDARLRFRTSEGAKGHHGAANAGYGLTQALVLVVAVISARQGDLVLIENPEAHLHPGVQAAMGGFLARAAAAGLQVVIETHSDHILNGIRRAVKEGELPPDDLLLYFFRQRDQAERGGKAQVESPAMDRDGSVDAWPDGFFDQYDKDVSYFAGW